MVWVMNDSASLLHLLLGYSEVILLIRIVYMIEWALLALVVAIIILHAIDISQNTSYLYRSRKPVSGWSRRFYPAVLLLIVGIGFVLVATSELVHGRVPFVQ